MSTIEFDRQFNKMSTLLHAFAYNLTKNVEDAKDLFQETAFRAMTNRDKFRAGTNLKAWLFTIMKNIFINNYRKKVKANTIMDSTDNLYYINLSNNLVSDISALSNLIKLEYLYLGHNAISNMEPIRGLTNSILQIIHLFGMMQKTACKAIHLIYSLFTKVKTV